MLGDCRASLRSLPECSVQSVITSPPYYGLRDYGLPPLVWGGDPQCTHNFGSLFLRPGMNGGPSVKQQSNVGSWHAPHEQNPCSCGAWLGSHGLEPTPELYLQHEVEIFADVRRVLRDDGVLWLNLGDSYAGSGKGPTGANGIGDQTVRQGFLNSRSNRPSNGLTGGKLTVDVSLGGSTGPGYKPKDLMLLPFRVAMALQADGWYVRSCIPWLKRNSMPESVTDRPSSAVEYVFLLSKSPRYFWDPDAVRIASDPMRTHWTPGTKQESVNDTSGRDLRNDGLARLGQRMNDGLSSGRNRRNSDWFFESWQGLLLDECDAPQALLVNPQPFSGAHFATFPPKLVEPMVKASTRPGDTVLDPFAGAGTVGLVADRLGRDATLLDLKPDYHLMASTRVTQDAPLFVQLEAGLFDGL
jgi:DNA modification methylase